MTPRHPDTPTCRGVSGDVGAPKQTGQVFGSCESLSGRAPGRPVRRRAGRGGAPGGAGQGPRGASSTVVPGPVQHGELQPASGPTWAGRHPTCRGDTPTYVGVSGCRGQLWLQFVAVGWGSWRWLGQSVSGSALGAPSTRPSLLGALFSETVTRGR